MIIIIRAIKFIQVILQQIIGSWRLTEDVESFFQLSLDFLLYRLLRSYTPWGINHERTIRVRGAVTITYRLNRGDIWTIYEVWLCEQYALPFRPKSNVVIDLGANIGLTSLWLAKKYGFSTIIAIEPSPSNARLARLNLANNGVDAIIVQAAAGLHNGSALFHESEWSTHNYVVTSNENVATASRYQISVWSLDKILALLGDGKNPGLIKFDVEGAEQEILTGNVDWLNSVEMLIAEFHPPHADVPSLLRILAASGYEHISPGAVVGCSMHAFVRRNAHSY